MAPGPPLRLAVTNNTGRVERSLTTLDLAGALEHVGHDVLVIDLDPTGYLSATALGEDYLDMGNPTVYDILNDQATLASATIDLPEFDFLRSTPQLMEIDEDSLIKNKNSDGLKTAIDRLTSTQPSKYDHIIIDCPISFGYLKKNAIHAADKLLMATELTQHPNYEIDLMNTVMDHIQTDIDLFGIVLSDVSRAADETLIEEWEERAAAESVQLYNFEERIDIRLSERDEVSSFHRSDDDQATSFIELAGDIASLSVE